ncbi:MAG: response regulator, partial [Acidobacteria bacterium]|nr:response regulator [Acidobacteriota bacterium]
MTPGIFRILLVEDDPADAGLVERYLGQWPPDVSFELERVDRVGRAHEVIERWRPDVLLLDLNLPDSHGLATVNTMLDQANGTPIVVMTGENDDELGIEAVRLGAQDYLIKDRVDSDSLARAIQYSIERKRIEEELRDSEERYALAVTGANDGVWDWNLKTDEIYFSERWMTMLGLESEEVPAHVDAWFERVHPDDYV